MTQGYVTSAPMFARLELHNPRETREIERIREDLEARERDGAIIRRKGGVKPATRADRKRTDRVVTRESAAASRRVHAQIAKLTSENAKLAARTPVNRQPTEINRQKQPTTTDINGRQPTVDIVHDALADIARMERVDILRAAINGEM